jgi:hypothetical protein
MSASERKSRREFVKQFGAAAGVVGLTSVASTGRVAAQEKRGPLTEAQVAAAVVAWCDGLVKIGQVYTDKGDYKKFASEFIDATYDYADGRVFFRPTLAASPRAFRKTKPGALAYFVGGDAEYPEDTGFALKPWVKVWADNDEANNGIQIHGDVAAAMGNIHLKAKSGDEVTVDKAFVFRRTADGKLRLIVHKSALPNEPAKK